MKVHHHPGKQKDAPVKQSSARRPQLALRTSVLPNLAEKIPTFVAFPAVPDNGRWTDWFSDAEVVSDKV